MTVDSQSLKGQAYVREAILNRMRNTPIYLIKTKFNFNPKPVPPSPNHDETPNQSNHEQQAKLSEPKGHASYIDFLGLGSQNQRFSSSINGAKTRFLLKR